MASESTGILGWLWLACLAALAFIVPDALRQKIKLWSYGILYLAMSRDTKFQLPSDPGKCRAPATKTKRIIFVRHGESVWNECFNRGFGPSFLLRLFKALLTEASLLFRMDSLFLDSPLNEEGLEQARALEQWVEGSEAEEAELRRSLETAVFTTSCLRRAASTASIGFAQALRAGRPLWVLSSLQEISRNVDTLALAEPRHAPPLSSDGDDSLATAACSMTASTRSSGSLPRHRARTLTATYHEGNKGLLTNGAHRMDAFCKWVFSDCSPAALQPTVVACGHSIWFRTFFQAYLPHTAYHECKQNKIVNCGVVMFDLELLETSESVEYRVVPGSVVSLRGGFEAKKAKRKGSEGMTPVINKED